MNVYVNPATGANVYFDHTVSDKYVIVQVKDGYHYINNEESFFVTNAQWEQIKVKQAWANALGKN